MKSSPGIKCGQGDADRHRNPDDQVDALDRPAAEADKSGAVFDTSIRFDCLQGVPGAREEIGRFTARAISVVTWTEVMIGAAPRREAATRAFPGRFEIVAPSLEIAERAVAIRRERRIKLPDADIRATAQAQGAPLVTRNGKDFPKDDPGVRVPYRR